MQNQLKITLIQTDTVWKDIVTNLQNIEDKIASIEEGTDLIVLPEMFSTGFVMQPNSIAETMEGSAIQWMKKTASHYKTALAGSLIIEENGLYFNRFIFVHHSGALTYYDKKHLFTLAGEDKIYTAGKHRLLFEYKGWKISPFVCYDLRFPVWSRNTEGYDIALYSANWPKPRINAWDSLLKARAIENMCYCIGVNRVGTDANNLEYNGHSQVIDPLGEILKLSQENEEAVCTAILDKEKLDSCRRKFQFLQDRDAFEFTENDG